MKHGEKSRIDYILRRLNQAGEIGRRDIMDAFDISKPQASKDIATFIALYPDAVIYDGSAKIYKATQLLPALPPESKTWTEAQIREAAREACFLPGHVINILIAGLNNA